MDCKTSGRRMKIEAIHSRLCRLIGDTLRPHGELVASSFTPEIEKDLLIFLSQVFRQIKLWTLAFDSDSDSIRAEETKDASESCVASGSYTCEHQCMSNIVAVLVSLISLQKPLIQHLAGNVLVAISEFASASETGWDEYIHLLCRWLKFALHNSLPSSAVHVLLQVEDVDFDSLMSVLPLQLRPENLNYLTVASILCVLHKILKRLKLSMNDKFLKVYLDLVTDTFSNVRWDLLNETYVLSNCEAPAGSGEHNLLQQCAVQSKSIAIFHGNLVQLCCSLVDISGLTEAGGETDVHPVIFQVKDLIPKIVPVCIGRPESCDDACIFHYLRHKILMLLVRLDSKVNLEHSDLISWLHIIEKYFQDLLLQPLKKVDESDQEDCLEGSPFWVDNFDAEIQRISYRHLQRLSVYLFLRCSLSLENLKEKADEPLTFVNSVSCTTFEFQFHSECSSRSEGGSILHKWLLSHLPSDIFVDHEMYPQRCRNFALSFLKLFIHEDDMLFEMLLQLFCIPCYNTRTDCEETSSMAMNDMFCLASDLFNPVYLFHLFLAEILYDHQVLLDYLISKDTGAKSAEYLLRCLRMVCSSWQLFVEFPAVGKSPNPSCQKRQKVLADGMKFEDGLSTTLLEDDIVSSTIETQCKKGHRYGSKKERAKRFSFEDAKDCLLSLKTRINSLNQKNLFPYNPQVLLRRLARFQELCLKEMKEQTTF